ncbi:MAG TPA: hypothetical protein VNZ52_07130 [Candidatus Thermoplasmatota archaeon]|nr:hypothetical protein [Candidatus Thermoplasmatota archaeon]
MARGRALLLVSLSLLVVFGPLFLSSVAAQVPSGRNEVDLAVIAYHPKPDPFDDPARGGDPFGFHAYMAPGRVPWDWMRGYYGEASFPTARFDGVGRVANNPSSDILAVEEDYRREFEARREHDAPLILNVTGRLNATHALLTVKVVNRGAEGDGLFLRAALYTDQVRFDAKNGVEVHRFLARARFNQTEAEVPVGESRTYQLAVRIPNEYTGEPLPRDRLGAVVYVQNENDASTRFKFKEVLQSAVFRYGQEGPTVQSKKAVLLEFYTATWCDACLYGDAAVDHLAAQYGVQTTPEAEPLFRYFTAPPALHAVLGAGVLGALAAALILPASRPRKGGR